MEIPLGKPGASSYYPPVGFHFDVRILDTYSAASVVAGKLGIIPNVDGSFQEVSGISVQIELEDLYEGGENRFVYKLPKGTRYTPLILKRGLVSATSALNEWCKETFEDGFNSPISTKEILVSLLNEGNIPLMSWVFFKAFPTKWDISNFNAQNSEVVVESLELTYHRFEVVNV